MSTNSYSNQWAWLKSYPPNIAWDADIPAHPLFTLLDQAEERYADKVAIDFLGLKITYAELADKVRKFTAGLHKLGVKKGVKVGILMPNCPQFVISYYAILKAGGTVVNYNPLYSPSEVCHQIEDSKTEIMITLALKLIYPKVVACLNITPLKKIIVSEFQEFLPFVKKWGFTLTRRKDISIIPCDKHHISFHELLKSEGDVLEINIDPDDVAVLQYTGGTTGVPKAAVLTHANLYANTFQTGLWFTGLKYGEEIIIGALPLFHVFSMTIVMNLSVHTGSTMLLYPKFDMVNILADIDRKHPTLIPGVPTMFAAINNYKLLAKYNLTSIKMGISGGGPLPQEVKAGFEKLTGAKLIEGYGLSESSPVASGNPLFGINKAGSIGMPFPRTIMQIRDAENPDKIMDVGEIGEICISGPQIMTGYLNNPEETRKVIRNGFLHTGDLGTMDSDGYFYVVDRIKEMIISGGYNIYPRNLEEILYQHPEVLEAAVIGIYHPERVQEPKAFIVKKPGATVTEAEIKEFMRENIYLRIAA